MILFFVIYGSDHFESNSSVVSTPVIIVVQPRLSVYQTIKLLSKGIKRDSVKLPFPRQIHGTLDFRPFQSSPYHQCYRLHMHGLGEHIHRLDFFDFVAFQF